jgi:hypothetical protein
MRRFKPLWRAAKRHNADFGRRSGQNNPIFIVQMPKILYTYSGWGNFRKQFHENAGHRTLERGGRLGPP